MLKWYYKDKNPPKPSRKGEAKAEKTKIKMKKIFNHSIFSTVWPILVSFLLVVGAAKLMALALNSFETTQRVEAETLKDLPASLSLNQASAILEDGYLKID